MKTRLWLICSIILLALPCIASAYQDVVVTAQYKQVTGGYRYYVNVRNDTNPTGNYWVRFFDLVISPTSDFASPNSDWSAKMYFNTQLEWKVGSTRLDWSKGVAPGQSLSGFAFTSTSLPSQIRYFGAAGNDQYDHTFNNYLYPTLMPVPEPSAFLALTTGLSLLGLPILRRRHRR